uniref:Uncharacterized protein n=1 Tax=Arundo donax TaxID=35708 RepID=A0A0A9C4H2_ARUDO
MKNNKSRQLLEHIYISLFHLLNTYI